MATLKNSNIPFYIICSGGALFSISLSPFSSHLFGPPSSPDLFSPSIGGSTAVCTPQSEHGGCLFRHRADHPLPAAVVGTLVFNESVQIYAALSPDTKHLNKNFDHLISSITNHPMPNFSTSTRP